VSGSGATGSSTGAGNTSADAGLSGIAQAGQSDAAYQQSYRECMKGRGF
jgi:hypothetical protein